MQTVPCKLHSRRALQLPFATCVRVLCPPPFLPQWQTYTDASGRAVLVPCKVLKGSTVSDLASTPDAYVRVRVEVYYRQPPDLWYGYLNVSRQAALQRQLAAHSGPVLLSQWSCGVHTALCTQQGADC